MNQHTTKRWRPGIMPLSALAVVIAAVLATMTTQLGRTSAAPNNGLVTDGNYTAASCPEDPNPCYSITFADPDGIGEFWIYADGEGYEFHGHNDCSIAPVTWESEEPDTSPDFAIHDHYVIWYDCGALHPDGGHPAIESYFVDSTVGSIASGAPLFQADADGDGVINASDNCPTINGPQTDSDGDGLGDVCDVAGNGVVTDSTYTVACSAFPPDPCYAIEFSDDDGIREFYIVALGEGIEFEGDNGCNNGPITWESDEPDEFPDHDHFVIWVDCGGTTGVSVVESYLVESTLGSAGSGPPVHQSVDADGDGVNEAADNCPAIANSSQSNNDRNFIDMPHFAFDDLTRANSDAFGDECDGDDDNDGIPDADETAGPPCATASAATDPGNADSDGDRFLDGAECMLGTDPASSASQPSLTACGPVGDTDGDKIADRIEFCRYNTNPSKADTDGDGCSDGREIASLNADRTVNVADMGILATYISNSNPYITNVDINKDGVLNPADQGILASQFGSC
jgi:hypothetical protein